MDPVQPVRTSFIGAWRLWIRALWFSGYALLLLVAVPFLVLDCINTQETGSLPIIKLIGGLFVLLTFPISVWEIVQHLIHYTKPYLQKHIIRILWMVPIYSIDAWFGLIYPKDAIYINSLRDCYTAYVIYNFMRFLLNYLNSQGDYESTLEKKERVKHMPPCCCLRTWEMGPQFLRRCEYGILQFTVVRPITTAAAFTCEMLGVYGENEFSFTVGYQYIMIINNLSQMVAMYCLVLFYKANRTELAPMNPLGKFICIKSVVFLTFFQSGIISILVNAGVIQMIFGMEDGAEIRVISSCLQNFLICIEMLFAAIAHHFVFTYKPYLEPDLEDLEWFTALGRIGRQDYSCAPANSDLQVKANERDHLLSASFSDSIGYGNTSDGTTSKTGNINVKHLNNNNIITTSTRSEVTRKK